LAFAPRIQNDSTAAVDNILCDANIGTFRWKHCDRLFNAWCAWNKEGPIFETDLLDLYGYHVSV
jgi:hypothetical protein